MLIGLFAVCCLLSYVLFDLPYLRAFSCFVVLVWVASMVLNCVFDLVLGGCFWCCFELFFCLMCLG